MLPPLPEDPPVPLSVPATGGDPDPAWVALSLVEHVGAVRLLALRDHFGGDLWRVLIAPEAELRRVRGIGPKIAAGIRAVDPARVVLAMARWMAAGVRIVPYADPAFPAVLRTISDPPGTLFMVGEQASPLRQIAIVGTRTPSPAARTIAHMLAVRLAERGVGVVSGLALGIDAAAHTGALTVPDGVTLAVLGGGVLNVYPPAHRDLAAEIQRRGLLLTETHPEAVVSAAALVARNRLISGLCEAVIVVETSATGGALHAARRALEQGRAVYTIDPAHLTGDTSGNAVLIAQGVPVLAADGHDLPV